MLTPTEFRALHADVMYDESLIRSAVGVLSAQDIEARVRAAEELATMTLIVTLDKLSERIAEIPSMRTMLDNIATEEIENFIKSLDSNR